MSKRKLIYGLAIFSFIAALFIPAGGLFAAPNEIKIGTVNSLTGTNAMVAAEHLWAYKQAVEAINEKGGIYVKEYKKYLPIKLIVADDKSMPDQGAAAMERLIKLDKIDVAISNNNTAIDIAAGTVCEKYKMYYSIVTSFLDFIEKENFKWVSDFFARTTDIAKGPFEVFDGLPENKRPKRLALLMEDNLDGQGFGAGFKANAPEYGYKFIVEEPFAPGTKDFSSHLLKYRYAKVDAVIALMPPTDAITLVRQMHEQRVTPLIFGYKGFWPREFADAMGDKANYVVHDGFWSSMNGATGSAELQDLYKKTYGKDSTSVGLSYSNVQIVAMAIERAGTLKAAAIRDEVFGGTFRDTVMGDVSYDEKGLASMPFLSLQWWNGDRMPVNPPMPDVWEMKVP